MLIDVPKRRPATIVIGRDGRMRAFTDTATCIGVVMPEDDIPTVLDEDPVGFFRGFAVMLLIFGVQALMLWGAFALGQRWHS